MKDFAKELREGPSYKEKVERCRCLLSDLVKELGSIEPVEWDRAKDPPELVQKIVDYAELSGRLRGLIPTERIDSGEYAQSFPMVEEPRRFATLLYNLARGRALILGRRNIDSSDLELVKEVALSSCPYGRSRLIRFLVSHGGEAKTDDVENQLGCCKAYALQLTRDLEVLGVVLQEEKERSRKAVEKRS